MIPLDRTCLYVICAAPLAERAPDIAQALIDDGWTVLPVATPSAADGWIDDDALERITGSKARSTYRTPDQPKDHRDIDAVLICPATLNTIGKLANGIADDYALSVVSECIGAGNPTLVIPMVNEHLWAHPAWGNNMTRLASASVRFLDPETLTDDARAVRSGTGAAIAAALDPRSVALAFRDTSDGQSRSGEPKTV